MRVLATIAVVIVIVLIGAWALGWFGADVEDGVQGLAGQPGSTTEVQPEVEVEELPETTQ